MRFVRFEAFLHELYVKAPYTQVFYEEVRGHKGVDAAHIYGGITSQLMAFCEKQIPKIPYMALPVGTVKWTATGKGNSDKEAMMAAAQIQWPQFKIDDDNQADALWILETGMQELGLKPKAQWAMGAKRVLKQRKMREAKGL